MTKQNNTPAETKKKKPTKNQSTPQNSGVSFTLGDRARIKLGKS